MMRPMIRTLALVVLALFCACASSKGRRAAADPNEEKAIAAAKEENTRLRAELAQARKDAEGTFNDASAAQSRLGTNGCAAVTSGGPPGNGSQSMRIQLRYGAGAAIVSFSGARNAGAAKVYPCSYQVRR